LLFGFERSFSVRELVKVLPHKLGVIEIDRTRVRLLFGDADLGKEFDQYLRFDLQLACQLVNSNLVRVRHLFAL
jgi:hypothetical protein